ncbi:fumarylacetoacetate hydrolase family protein [Propylenella binzhouense]|nr:fumarylacetoacetate hydrolase family protein [Propylenella binzhouense]
MKLVRFRRYRRVALGALLPDAGVVDLATAAATLLAESGDPCADAEAALRLPPDMVRFIAGGAPGRALAEAAIDFALARGAAGGVDGEPLVYGSGEVRLLPPLVPPLLIGAGAAFRDGPDRRSGERVRHREFFLRDPFNMLGPEDGIALRPWLGDHVDAWPRLAVLIGRRLRRASADEAAAAIFGYCPAIDLCIRDQHAISWAGALFHVQYPHARAFDGSLLLGPVVSRDEAGDPAALGARMTLDGEIAYDGPVPGDWGGLPAWIAALSNVVTLEPGSVLIPAAEGDAFVAPSGDGSGPAEIFNPPPLGRYLAPGMSVAVEIERVGAVRAGVRAADPDALRGTSAG